MDLDGALRYLEAHLNREATGSLALAGQVDGLTLDPTRRLLEVLGDPQSTYPVIHVTGTNGKGSVAAMVARLLGSHGLTVGVYTSPHLERVNERIARLDESISDDELADAIGAVAAVEELAGVTPSYFEILTVAALAWFAEVAVDVAVVEVGLLGRYDATNVVDAQVAVITNVGKDHTDGTPGWRERVAAEKAGIIGPGSTVVLGADDPSLRPIFAAEPCQRLLVGGEDFDLEQNELAVGGRLVDVRTPLDRFADLYLSVHGAHQGDNAAVALTATESFFERPLDHEAVAEALGSLVLPGRFEVVGRNPLVVLDSAHNPAGAAATAATLVDFRCDNRFVVVGLLDGRDPAEVLAALGVGPRDLVVVCTPDSPRAIPAELIARAARGRGADAESVRDPVLAFDHALGIAGEDDLVLVTGSHYVTGPVRRAFRASTAS